MNKLSALFILLLLSITLHSWSQGVAGYVNDINTGLPVVNHSVVVQTDSTYGPYYYVETFTDFNGYFQASLPTYPGDSSGVVYVSTLDCQQSQQLFTYNYPEFNTIIVCHIYICSVPPAGCQANFTYSAFGPLSLQFLDQSIGQDTLRTWYFGDGYSSNLANPVHTYQYPGYYDVYLTIGEQGSSCWDQEIITVWVGDSIQNGCQAFFVASQDPGIAGLVHFYDQSVGIIDTYTWDFGDNNVVTVTSPANPAISHQYNASGVYSVCLTVQGADSLCSNTYCTPVMVDTNFIQCQAGFTYSSIPGTNQNTVQFFDQSVSMDSITWNWNFGDPASGVNNSSTLQNPIKTFSAPGTYTVCLIISSGTCSDTICLPVMVGQNSGCQAQFTYVAVAGASPNVFQFTDQSYYPGQVSWLWNFDDGSVSTEQNPLHIFPSNTVLDPYNVCLTITSADSMCVSTFCLPVLPQNSGCQAAFEAVPAAGAVRTINFSDLSQGSIWTWTWDFGDGTTQTVASPNNPDLSHTYQFPGFYNVCLTVQGDNGSCISTYCETVAVYDSIQGCQAQFTYYPDSASSTGNSIQFVDLSLGNPAQWYWEFGDPLSGSYNISLLQNPIHVFSAPGTYYVCLTIVGPNCQSVWCGDVVIGGNPDCINYFTYSQIGQSVNFEGFMLNGSAGEYQWDFGDNQTATGQNVVHTYSTQGTYNVSLVTTDPATGCTYTSSQIISVGDTTIWGQLYGQVFEGNFPATAGMVLLFSVDTNNVFVPFVDVAVLDSAGVYYFPMVPVGNYVIYAIPFGSGYLPTYYGNTLYWQNAAIVQPSTGTPNIPYNINLIESSAYTAGIGSIGGQISQGDFSGSLIDKVTMLLKDENGNTILYSQVDPAGTFDFPQLAYGTYYLYAEMAGCETQAIQVIISEANPTAMVMLTLSGNSILGINNKQITLDAGVVYPNPVRTDAQITVKITAASELSIEIYSMSGQLIYTKTEPVSIGESTFVIGASQFPEGMYMLKIYTREGLLVTRKLVKTN